MTPERWQQVEALYHAALGQEAARRNAFLIEACQGDDELREEVESLLQISQSGEDILQQPAWDGAGELVETESRKAALVPGTRLGPYEIIGVIGVGGMGEVYRARDSRLNRDVAVKVLPRYFATDPDRLRWFNLEARSAGSLNHPNVLAIYDIGAHAGAPFIVSELLEGESLRAHLKRGKLSVPKAVEIARQIAAGLAAAHGKGITHRDIKPENLFIVADGRVKILDFGLAKRKRIPADVEPGEAESPSTRPGLVVGTVAYMSPEQVRGEAVDHRSDIFSFGCVLYEMLTGQRAFKGSSSVETMHAILKQDPPDLATSENSFPPVLTQIVRRCLEKNREQRFQSAADLAFNLETLSQPSLASNVKATGSIASSRSHLWIWTTIITVSVATGMLFGMWLWAKPSIDIAKHRYSPVVTAMHSRRIEEGGGAGAHLPAWSPDGRSIVYSADGLRIQRLDGFESLRLTTEGVHPFFSVDGSRVYYLTSPDNSRELWSVSAAGGAPERVLSDLGGFGSLMGGAAISRDGSAVVVVGPGKGGDDEMSVWVSSPPGATPRLYPGSPSARFLSRAWLRFSPDGTKLLVTFAHIGQPVEWWLLKWPPDPAPEAHGTRRLFENSPSSLYATTADWLLDNRHMVVSAQEDEYTPGAPLWIADTVTGQWRRITNGPFACQGPTVSRDGRVLFHMPKVDEQAIEIPLDGSPIRRILAGLGREQYPSWSPVAGQMLFVTNQRHEPEIWLASHKEGWQRPVVTQRDFPPDPHRRDFISPVFSPDGTRIAYTSKGAIWISPVAGGPPIRISDGYCPTWSPDARWLAFVTNPRGSARALMKVPVGRPRDAVVIRHIKRLSLPRWSPDGKWITVQMPEGFGVISPDGARTRVLYKGTLDWGSACGWSNDGSVLFLAYLTRNGRVLSAFDIATGDERIVRDLGPLHFSYLAYHSAGLSASPDGKSLAASVLSMRFEAWILDGLEPPHSFWSRLFRR
jgi:serine/threonine protein kinase/Tol biopolymer transport system component